MGPEGVGCPVDCAVGIGADDWPIVLPAHRLKVNDAAVRSVGLEVDEPAFAIRRFDIAALVRAVDVG